MIGCAAIAIGIHIGSYHFDRKLVYNEFNPGAYVSCNEYVVGAYRNSENKNSAYFGYQFAHVIGPVDILVGAVTGYSRAAVAPLLIPTVKWENIRMAIILPVKDVAAGFHFSLEF